MSNLPEGWTIYERANGWRFEKVPETLWVAEYRDNGTQIATRLSSDSEAGLRDKVASWEREQVVNGRKEADGDSD